MTISFLYSSKVYQRKNQPGSDSRKNCAWQDYSSRRPSPVFTGVTLADSHMCGESGNLIAGTNHRYKIKKIRELADIKEKE